MPVIDSKKPVIDLTHFVTSPFGSRTIQGKISQHNGVDIVGWDGKWTTTATILSYADGKVIAEGYDKTRGFFIEIQNADCLTVYYHLRDAAYKKVGEFVKMSEPIGYMGNTGSSTGAHLHFGIKKDGSWIDPVPFLLGEDMDSYEDWKKNMERYQEELKNEAASSWASDNIEWARSENILFGDEKGNLAPRSLCTREMVITFIRRALKK